MFLCRLGARRQIAFLLRNGPSVEKFKGLFDVDTFPHGDTLNKVFSKLDPEQGQNVVSSMTNTPSGLSLLFPYNSFFSGSETPQRQIIKLFSLIFVAVKIYLTFKNALYNKTI